ncbi:hypothetical protein FisN_22Lh170 [Fistulifera solaris]|uniref:Transmembrane protein n=1 Tax=Fistulifera solaris TaxID=1519565 RepID=A0A1Z5JBY7_FISSO|nr:hypothetical protein FisN_22Lh170 [Fistulifera solaris]|eukprot:GAX11485.1 hypothetical protein FisN_22Lh170 [Fistulifera solaris]
MSIISAAPSMKAEDNLFTFLSPCQALDRTFRIYRHRWFLFTQLALFAIVPQIALTVYLKTATNMDEKNVLLDLAVFFGDPFTDSVAFLFIALAAFCVFNTITQIIMIQVVAEYYTQTKSTLQGSLRVLWDRFHTVHFYVWFYTFTCCCFMVELVMTALIVFNPTHWSLTILTAICACFAAYFVFWATVNLPILIVERHRGPELAKKANTLICGHGCYLLYSMMLLLVPLLAGNWMYRKLLDGIFGTAAFTIVLKGLVGLLFLPIRTILLAVLYFSARVKVEGLTMEALIEELQREDLFNSRIAEVVSS